MIYITRHGQTDWNLLGRMQGHTDIPLNDTGRAQAYDLAKKVAELDIKHIFSSDLKRARETAEIVNKSNGNLEIVFDKRLREVCYGDLEGKTRADLGEDVWGVYNRAVEELNAERLEDVFSRVKEFLQEIQQKKLKDVLIVTHGGLIRMVAYYLDNPEYNHEGYMKFFNESRWYENAQVGVIDFETRTMTMGDKHD